MRRNLLSRSLQSLQMQQRAHALCAGYGKAVSHAALGLQYLFCTRLREHQKDNSSGCNPENMVSVFSLTDGLAKIISFSLLLISAVMLLDLQGAHPRQIPLQDDSTCVLITMFNPGQPRSYWSR